MSVNVTLSQTAIAAGLALLGVTLLTSGVRAQEMYAGIQARIPNIVLMTTLLGPFNTAESCEIARKISRDEISDGCAVCVFEYNKYFSSSSLAGIYRRAIDKMRIKFPYIVTTVSRMIFSEGNRKVLADMCEAAAAEIRNGLDPTAICVKPSG